MRRKTDKYYDADELGLKIRWALIGALLVLLSDRLSSPSVLAAVGMLAVSNGLSWAIWRSRKFYEGAGRNLIVGLRLFDGIVVSAASFAPSLSSDNIWLLGLPLILTEGLFTRSWKRLVGFTGAMSAIQFGAFLAGAIPARELGYSVGLFGFGMLLSIVLSVYRVREEMLSARDRRLATVLESASALVSSRDLGSMVLHTLRSAVQDLGASAGYVMLVSEEQPDSLLTEAAYSKQGDFQFPGSVGIGDGVSGYVSKMGQPLEIQNTDDLPLEYDGIVAQVASAVSVPLATKSYTVAGQSASDQITGAMTLLYASRSQPIDREDLELLQSLGSLIAIGVVNARMEERQRTTFLRTLQSLATALEARDDYTRGHSQRVCDLSLMIGKQMGIGPEALEELRVGTILHDIGKIGVPDAILNKPGRLTDEEFVTMKQHPVIGYEICKPLRLSEGVLMIIRNHHEKLDGSGYPDGLKGGELPLSLRIVCVADAYDAMSSRRPYRGVMDIQSVLSELSKGAGVQFDPVVVECLKELLNSGELNKVYGPYWNKPKEAA